MGKIIFFKTTIGKKILMATTGILFCSFLLLHLLNNLALFFGPETFNSLVNGLENIKPIIRVLEVLLLIILLIHVYNAFSLMFNSKKARPDKYKTTSTSSSTFSSRTMIISGTIILFFLTIHIGTIWKTFQETHDPQKYFNIVTENKVIGFGNPLITILYMITMIFIGLHIKHGFESSFKTFGINNLKTRKILNKISFIFWFFIPLGFFMIALWFGILKDIL